ncbi:MAG: alpha/beta hydrolase [Gammaproteobacteria bacterium]|nr:alpha/beta hydrolase [Gammaproteobacteria bacterium]|tara:strand:- start:1170 stop:2078 length:909 start_codon:yes stop_codon:yes gene_type:complete
MRESPKQHTITVDGCDLVVFEWMGQSQETQQVLLVHATGFHARCWDQVVALLPEEWQIFAVDMRGHGRSANVTPYTWQRFGDDLLHVCDALQLSNAIGVGHSMGGHCVTHSCGHNESFFRQLLLIDPVIMDPQLYQSSVRHQYADVSEHPIARRRRHFADAQAMFDRYAERSPYALWDPRVFRDYCDFGVVPSQTDDVMELACPPEVEASIYMGNFDSNLYDLIPNIETPVVVLRAKPRDPESQDMDFTASPTWPELADQFANAQDVYLPELTHFIPMQDPQLVAEFIIAAADVQPLQHSAE